MSVDHTFFLLASAYSHGTQESHYYLLATVHASRVTGLLRSISVFPVQENHVNTKENTSHEKYRTRAEPANLLTTVHWLHWCQLFIDNQSSLLLSDGSGCGGAGGRTGSGMVIIIIVTQCGHIWKPNSVVDEYKKHYVYVGAAASIWEFDSNCIFTLHNVTTEYISIDDRLISH